MVLLFFEQYHKCCLSEDTHTHTRTVQSCHFVQHTSPVNILITSPSRRSRSLLALVSLPHSLWSHPHSYITIMSITPLHQWHNLHIQYIYWLKLCIVIVLSMVCNKHCPVHFLLYNRHITDLCAVQTPTSQQAPRLLISLFTLAVDQDTYSQLFLSIIVKLIQCTAKQRQVCLYTLSCTMYTSFHLYSRSIVVIVYTTSAWSCTYCRHVHSDGWTPLYL